MKQGDTGVAMELPGVVAAGVEAGRWMGTRRRRWRRRRRAQGWGRGSTAGQGAGAAGPGDGCRVAEGGEGCGGAGLGVGGAWEAGGPWGLHPWVTHQGMDALDWDTGAAVVETAEGAGLGTLAAVLRGRVRALKRQGVGVGGGVGGAGVQGQ